LETGRPVRRQTLEDQVLKFIERNNRGIWIGILALCTVTVLVTERGRFMAAPALQESLIGPAQDAKLLTTE